MIIVLAILIVVNVVVCVMILNQATIGINLITTIISRDCRKSDMGRVTMLQGVEK